MPGDVGRVQAGIAQLSPISLLMRYGKAVPPQSRALAGRNSLDGRTSFAIGACDRRSGAPVGVARFVASSPTEAEIAVTVVDAWQGRGVGGMLLDRLVEHAADAGIETLTAWVFPGNRRAVRLMRRIGGHRVSSAGSGLVELRAVLAQAATC